MVWDWFNWQPRCARARPLAQLGSTGARLLLLVGIALNGMPRRSILTKDKTMTTVELWEAGVNGVTSAFREGGFQHEVNKIFGIAWDVED